MQEVNKRAGLALSV